MSLKLEIPREAIAEFCRRNHIRRLALFGAMISAPTATWTRWWSSSLGTPPG